MCTHLLIAFMCFTLHAGSCWAEKWNWVTDSCECLKSNPDPLEEQPVFLTLEPSFPTDRDPPFSVFKFWYWRFHHYTHHWVLLSTGPKSLCIFPKQHGSFPPKSHKWELIPNPVTVWWQQESQEYPGLDSPCCQRWFRTSDPSATATHLPRYRLCATTTQMLGYMCMLLPSMCQDTVVWCHPGLYEVKN